MSTPITIAKAKPSDAETLSRFDIDSARETEQHELSHDVVKSAVEQVLTGKKQGFYLVARINDQIVGVLRVTFDFVTWKNADSWWLRSLRVAPEHRRQGIATRLIQTLKDMAHQQGDVASIRVFIDEHNEVSRAVCEQNGFSASRYSMFEVVLQELAKPIR